MTNLLVDTCVIIHIVRESEIGKKCLEKISNIDEEVNIIISVVTKAEMESFALQNNWGQKKTEILQRLLDECTIIDINHNDKKLIDIYSEIDSFSKRKIQDRNGNMLVGSAIKMGKNDLWIAATACTLDILLFTADGDFDHLKNIFIDIIKA